MQFWHCLHNLAQQNGNSKARTSIPFHISAYIYQNLDKNCITNPETNKKYTKMTYFDINLARFNQLTEQSIYMASNGLWAPDFPFGPPRTSAETITRALEWGHTRCGRIGVLHMGYIQRQMRAQNYIKGIKFVTYIRIVMPFQDNLH